MRLANERRGVAADSLGPDRSQAIGIWTGWLARVRTFASDPHRRDPESILRAHDPGEAQDYVFLAASSVLVGVIVSTFVFPSRRRAVRAAPLEVAF